MVKKPGEAPCIQWINNDLTALQKIVGGYIETITIHGLGEKGDKTAVVICNEEGKLRGLPYNCKIMGEPIVGNLLICGGDGEEFADLPLTIMQAFALLEVE